MFGSKVKNFKLAPTSELVFYIINNDQIDLSASELYKILTERLTKKYKLNAKKANRIVERDKDIIISRGSDLSNYIFDYSRGLKGTEEAFYRKLNISDEGDYESRIRMTGAVLSERLEKFTLSEICFQAFLEYKFRKLYHKRGKLLQEQIQKSRNSISDRGISALDEYIQKEISDEKSLYEENKNMEKFHDMLFKEFTAQFFGSFYTPKEFKDYPIFILASSILILYRESAFCINENKRSLKEECADFKDLSSDVASLDKQVISKSEGASKVYRLATHSMY